MVDLRLMEWEKVTGQKIDRKEYSRYLHPARFMINLRQAGFALKELAQAVTYQDISIKYREIEHHLELVQESLAEIGDMEGNITKYAPLAKQVCEKFGQAIETIPSETKQAAYTWAIN